MFRSIRSSSISFQRSFHPLFLKDTCTNSKTPISIARVKRRRSISFSAAQGSDLISWLQEEKSVDYSKVQVQTIDALTADFKALDDYDTDQVPDFIKRDLEFSRGHF